MKFESFTGNRRSRRQNVSQGGPAIVESLESRALLAGPQVLTPTGTITDSTPVISWEAVDGAVSYDLWVSDVEAREVIFREFGLGTTNYTPPTELHLGRNRIWVQANFAGNSTSGWGPLKDVLLQVAPVVTGPTNASQPGTPFKINDTQPTITWTSPPGARSFEIFFSDQTRLISTTYRVGNLTAVQDDDGNPIPDGQGDVVREEVRSFEIPSELLMGQYRVFIRTTDDGGRVSGWSSAFNFEVAPAVTALRPSGPSFQNPALLEWSPVPGATHYEVWVSRVGTVSEQTPIYNPQFLTTTNYQIPRALAVGNYVFFVRAKLLKSGQTDVVGIWSTRKEFGTIQNPVITGPVGFSTDNPEVRIVTDARPILEWTAIDKAARYEIWVDRTASNSTYLLATSSVNSYRFESDIQSGNYWVWVRALSTTGVATGWSEPYKFTATGGAPVITSPSNNSNSDPLPTITWLGVAEADHYEIHIAWVDVDFDFIQVTGIASTEFTPLEPLDSGTYRVWVRAIKADGTVLGWSEPVSFIVADSGQAPEIGRDSSELTTLTSLLSGVAATDHTQSDTSRVESLLRADEAIRDEQSAEKFSRQTPTLFPTSTPPAENPSWPAAAEARLIENLAQACATQEWWSAT